MKKGGIEVLVIAAIIIFVLVKVVAPKFTDGAGGKILVYQSLSELETAIEDIRQYHMKYGKFEELSMMTSAQGFERRDVRVERDVKLLYGIRDAKTGTANWCATLSIGSEGGEDYIFVNPAGNSSPECKEFTRDPKFQNLRKTKLNY